MIDGTILDTGPLVAFFSSRDKHHEWAVERFAELPARFVTCEAILTEAFHLIGPLVAPDLARLLEKPLVEIGFEYKKEQVAVHALMRKYRDVPMSFADACVVRMTELYDLKVLTVDADFLIYRKNGREKIPVILPG